MFSATAQTPVRGGQRGERTCKVYKVQTQESRFSGRALPPFTMSDALQGEPYDTDGIYKAFHEKRKTGRGSVKAQTEGRSGNYKVAIGN